MRIVLGKFVGRRFWVVLLAAIVALGLVACGDSEDSADNNKVNNHQEQPTGISVSGTWVTAYETVEEISDTKWDYAVIVAYDNAERFAITQNPEDDAFGPSKFNKLVWTEVVEDSFYYCMVAYGQETQADAEGTTETADESGVETDGCGGFSWTKMTRQ